MKYSFLIVLSVVVSHLATSQGSSPVDSSDHEMVGVRKQKFIDRYENVFMTKQPTKHLFKMGVMPFGYSKVDVVNYTNSPVIYGTYFSTGLGRLSVGYEYKLTPAFSVGLSLSGMGSASRRAGESFNYSGNINFSGQVRWYYDMPKRISQGKSANNFSGNYLGLTYDRYLEANPWYRQVIPRLGLEYGIQRRFFNRGFADLTIGVYRSFEGSTRKKSPTGSGEILHYPSNEPEWRLESRAVVGLAFGDWKKRSDLPYCEVLRCDEQVNSQLTLSWPNVNVGVYQQMLSGGVGYEQRLLPSLSAKANAYAMVNSAAPGTGSRVTHMELVSNVQVRYYPGQRKARRNGTGGYDFGGFYVGPLIEYSRLYNKSKYLGKTATIQGASLKVGITVGYQKALFRNIYLDLNGSQAWNVRLWDRAPRNNPISFRVGFGLRF